MHERVRLLQRRARTYGRIRHLRILVSTQRGDESLWYDPPATMHAVRLQEALRRVHREIEEATR